jgi:hypothetical protein
MFTYKTGWLMLGKCWQIFQTWSIWDMNGYDIVVFINYDYDILWLCVLITLCHYYVVLHMSLYHLVIYHSHGKSPFLIGKPSINGPLSMPMLNNQGVCDVHSSLVVSRLDHFTRRRWRSRGVPSAQATLEVLGVMTC